MIRGRIARHAAALGHCVRIPLLGALELVRVRAAYADLILRSPVPEAEPEVLRLYYRSRCLLGETGQAPRRLNGVARGERRTTEPGNAGTAASVRRGEAWGMRPRVRRGGTLASTVKGRPPRPAPSPGLR